ncbi:TetR/AcrR family transcriptional regulator [Aldersonia sp. NBC_00410]|uniref:TetR/AcrR family transcriptional regulator n=1 Tax=Aldersonia sp. NBC_00410 TaxID=2975954 RepID=UPI00224FF77E|nr:TetR/AcrR family transcriptional regulator [Aldersonia sp. NBC_00410]MCX5045516.1 TetR/AcrR family transcriptional regulator [Aldersonia sp. NBC_00410]
MARQARAEITRDAVLTGAAEVFLRLGYANASLNEIMAQANVTKGALYFHFGSKEELARAVVDLGIERLAASRDRLADNAPALEVCISYSYLVADLALRDRMVASMLALNHQIGDYRGTSNQNMLAVFIHEHTLLVKRAIEEGDVLPDLDPDSAARLMQELTAGVHVIALGTGELEQMPARMERMWFHLLPSLVPESKLGYFREYAARRARRY